VAALAEDLAEAEAEVVPAAVAVAVAEEVNA
jgi:hypothetical protein